MAAFANGPSGSEEALRPSTEEIALRAFEKWAARGRIRGTQERDWFEAEAEISLVRGMARQLLALEARLARHLEKHSELERRLGTEHAVSQILATSPSLIEAAPDILRAICQCLDWDVGVFWRVDGRGKALRCIHVWHSIAAMIPAFEPACRETQFPMGIGLPGRVWASETLHCIPDLSSDTNFPRATTATREGLRGAVGFPIQGESGFLGVMEFFSREVRQPDQSLIQMMTHIGGQISQFIVHRQAEEELCRQAEDRRLAREIQQGLLPKAPPALPGFEIAGRMLTAADVGGDCFDFFAMPIEDREALGVLVADASGHGLAAALMMAEMLAYVRALSLTCSNAGALLTLANRRLSDEIATGSFLTALLVQLEPHDRLLRYASAGHCAGYVLDRDGLIRMLLASTGGVLGIDETSEIPAGPSLVLESGELIFLYTDGIVEAFSPEGGLFGISPVLDVVRYHRCEPAINIVQAIFCAVDNFSEQIRHDDMTAVIIKVA